MANKLFSDAWFRVLRSGAFARLGFCCLNVLLRFLIAYLLLLRYIMRASTHTTCFAALSRTIIIPTLIPFLTTPLYSFDLIHESAELLGTVLPLPPPSLSYVSVSFTVGG
jgi:hypothetical protein